MKDLPGFENLAGLKLPMLRIAFSMLRFQFALVSM